MRPLNYALLHYFTINKEGDAVSVMEALKDQYGNSRTFNRKSVAETLMTAASNKLLEETHCGIDENDNSLRIYYKVTSYGSELINRFIK